MNNNDLKKINIFIFLLLFFNLRFIFPLKKMKQIYVNRVAKTKHVKAFSAVKFCITKNKSIKKNKCGEILSIFHKL